MEREIKFRGKSIDTGKWVYGGYHKPFDDVVQIIEHIKSNASQMTLVDESTIGQFIGEKDKKGVDIYEGDITRDKYVIKWHKEKALFAEHFYSTFQKTWNLSSYPISTKEIEIVNNIHDKL